MENKYIIISLPHVYDSMFEVIQKELFDIGFGWYENQNMVKTSYPSRSNILLLENKMYLMDNIDIDYISKKNKIIRFDIVSYMRYLKIKKLRYGK